MPHKNLQRVDRGVAPKIASYTPEQQEAYEKLLPRQRAFVEYRVQGYSKTDAYKKAGYKISKNINQNAYLLEQNNETIRELIKARSGVAKLLGGFSADSPMGQRLAALESVKRAEDVLEKIENSDPEQIKQINFYRKIVEGELKTTKKTTYTDKAGIKSYKEEVIDDIEVRMKARKELDKLLGLNAVVDIGTINTGDITIKIVDASKKEELEDTRNDINIDGELVDVDGNLTILKEVEGKGEGIAENDNGY